MWGISLTERALLLALVAAALALAALGAHNVRLRASRDAARAALIETRATAAAQRAEFEARSRERERAQHRALAEIQQQHQEALHDTQIRHEAVLADLRTGALRLRAHWQGCVATAELSRAAADAARLDEAARLRAAGAADLVRAAAQCDAQVRGLQAAVRAYAGAGS